MKVKTKIKANIDPFKGTAQTGSQKLASFGYFKVNGVSVRSPILKLPLYCLNVLSKNEDISRL